MYGAQNERCFYCLKKMNDIHGDDENNYTFDHFYPKSQGNKLRNNMVLCHPLCNLNKGHRHPTKAEIRRKHFLYERLREL